MARQSFTREEALQYLAGRTDLTWKKPLAEQSTDYLKRQASYYQRAEQAGREAPKRKEIRGHAKERIRYIPSSTAFADSYEVGTKRYPARLDEMLPLLAKTGDSQFVHIIIYGIPINYGPNWTDPKKPDWRTYRVLRSHVAVFVENVLKNKTLKTNQAQMADFAEWASGVAWSKVYTIAMRAAPDNPYGKSARRKKG